MLSDSCTVKKTVLYVVGLNNLLFLFLFQEESAWTFPKDFPFFEVINNELKRIKEFGILQKMTEKQVGQYLKYR